MLFLLFLLSSGLFLTTLTVNGIPGEKQRQPGTRVRQQVRRRDGTQGVDTRLCKKEKLQTKDSKKRTKSGQSIYPSLSISVATFTHCCSVLATGEHPDWAKPREKRARPFHYKLARDWAAETTYRNITG